MIKMQRLWTTEIGEEGLEESHGSIHHMHSMWRPMLVQPSSESSKKSFPRTMSFTKFAIKIQLSYHIEQQITSTK